MDFIGRYRILKELGQGAMGVVFLAEDENLKRKVAIKTLQGESLTDDDIERFRREAKIVASIKHPNIVGLLDHSDQLDCPFIAFEYIDGHPLSAHIEKRSPLPVQQTCEWACQLFDGLAFAHQQGVIHRDVKPANILIDAQNRIRICDFGLAWDDDRTKRLTKTGMIVGTPAYLAPEVVKGFPACAASDVYSAASTLFEMLTGRPPFEALSVEEALHKRLREDPPSPRSLRRAIPRALSSAVMDGLSRIPEERPTASELASALKRVSLELPNSSYGEETGGDTIVIGSLEKQDRCPQKETIQRKVSLSKVHIFAFLLIITTLLVTVLHFNSARKAHSLPTPRLLFSKATDVLIALDGGICKNCSYILENASGKKLMSGLLDKKRLVFRALRPETKYALSLNCSTITTSIQFITAPVLQKGILAIGTNDGIYVQGPSNVSNDIALKLSNRKNEHISCVLTGDRAYLPLPKEWTEPRSVDINLSWHGNTLTSGRMSTRRPDWQIPNPPSQSSNLDICRPSVNPIWFGDKFVFSSHWGIVYCYQLIRYGHNKVEAGACKLLWAYSPTRMMARLHLDRVAGLVVLDGEYIMGLAVGKEWSLNAWCIHSPSREKRWNDLQRKQLNLPVNLPEFVLEDNHQWNLLSAENGEWQIAAKLKRGLRPQGNGLLHKGLLYAQVSGNWNIGAGWVCIDPKNRRYLWSSLVNGPSLSKSPFHDDNKWYTPSDSRRGIGPWRIHSPPELIGSTIYTLVQVGKPEGQKSEGRDNALIACPLDGPEKRHACFRFIGTLRRHGIATSPSKDCIWVSSPTHIYRLNEKSEGSPKSFSLAELIGSQKSKWYLAGPLFWMGKERLVLAARSKGFFAAEFHVVKLLGSDTDIIKGEIGQSLFVDIDRPFPCVMAMEVTPSGAYGATNHICFGIDRSCSKFGCGQIAPLAQNRALVQAFSIGPSGVAVSVGWEGKVTLWPLIQLQEKILSPETIPSFLKIH